MKNKREHTYTKYRPDWCNHSTFESIDYCWGLASAVDRKELGKFLKKRCRDCDLSKRFIGWKEDKEK